MLGKVRRWTLIQRLKSVQAEERLHAALELSADDESRGSEALLGALLSDDVRTRNCAVSAIRSIQRRGPRITAGSVVINGLLHAIDTASAAPLLRYHAIESLGLVSGRNREVIDALVRAATSDQLQTAAVTSLRALGATLEAEGVLEARRRAAEQGAEQELLRQRSERWAALQTLTGAEIAVDVVSQLEAAFNRLSPPAQDSHEVKRLVGELMLADRKLAESNASPLEMQRVCDEILKHSERILPVLPPLMRATVVHQLEDVLIRSGPGKYPARYERHLEVLGWAPSRTFLARRRNEFIDQLKTNWPMQYAQFSRLLHTLPVVARDDAVKYLNQVRADGERESAGEAIREYALEGLEYCPEGLVGMRTTDDVVHYANRCAGGLDSCRDAAVKPATGDVGTGITQFVVLYKWVFKALEDEGDCWGTNWFIAIRVSELEFLARSTKAASGNDVPRGI